MLSYEEARFFLEQTSRQGSILGLENMRALMKELGNPQNDIAIIHIAGTNGKGSVGAYLASILKEAGLKVGRYCSPAVFDPLECWQYDGRNISKEEYADAVSQVKDACDSIRPTVFEVETAMAFVYFKQMQVDVLLLETGMGGATDATNVVEHPLACVFTTISRDHMQFLGETLEEIAKVKAGIIKKGTKVFSAEQQPEVCYVLDSHMKKSIDGEREEKIHYVSSKDLKLLSFTPNRLYFEYAQKHYLSGLSALYQMQNAALAIDVAQYIFECIQVCFSGLGKDTHCACTTQCISASAERLFSVLTKKDTSFFDKKYYILKREKQDEILQRGIENTSWPGRFEVIGRNPLFIIDGAHNEDAVKQLAITVEKSFTNQPIDFIIGVLADKEHEKMLEYMMPFAGQVFTVTPPNSRGLDAKLLAEEVQKLHSDVKVCNSIEEAISSAITHSKKTGNPILAFGSLSYLGELKEKYILEADKTPTSIGGKLPNSSW